MKIKSFAVNNHKKCFEINLKGQELELPFSELQLKPSIHDKIAKIYIDPELGNQALTYVLQSGQEDTIHMDDFLAYNRDPDYMRMWTLHNLTCFAVNIVKKSGVRKRELIRRMKCSPTQLYRLLDTACYGKTVDQMIKLILCLGYELEWRPKAVRSACITSDARKKAA